jgi:hypothetical protein
VARRETQRVGIPAIAEGRKSNEDTDLTLRTRMVINTSIATSALDLTY